MIKKLLFVTYFALVTGATGWVLYFTTLSYGQTRFLQGAQIAAKQCKQRTGAILPYGVTEGLTLEYPAPMDSRYTD